MPLIRIPAAKPPNKFGWLVPGYNCTQLALDILLRADRDVGTLEIPNGSNRGKRIDEWTRRSGLPPGQWWCAIWCGAVAADCGLMVPKGYPLTDTWLPYVRDGRWAARPQPGDFVIYGLRRKGPVVAWGDAHHIGIMARLAEPKLGQKITLTIEGNRSYAGTTSNNGLAVDIGPMVRSDILGYVDPEKLRVA